MTLPYSPSRAVYQGNGAATAFPFAFKVWSTDQLSVSVTSPDGFTAAAQGWTASLGECGGTLTYLHEGAPLPAGWRLARSTAVGSVASQNRITLATPTPMGRAAPARS